MIRFVDLRGAETGYKFAFWDTVTDKFVELSGEQAWDSKEAFIESCWGQDYDRYVRLMPDWVSMSTEVRQTFVARFSLSGKIVGYARNVKVTQDRHPLTCEINTQVTMESFRIIDPPYHYGLSFQRKCESLLTEGSLSMEIEDTSTGETVLKLKNVILAWGSWSILGCGIAGENNIFAAIVDEDSQ